MGEEFYLGDSGFLGGRVGKGYVYFVFWGGDYPVLTFSRVVYSARLVASGRDFCLCLRQLLQYI